MKVSLYLDEDAQDSDLVLAFKLHRVDVVGAWDAGMRQRDDDQHLEFATLHSRVLFGFNVRDCFRIHTEFLLQNKSHAGIVLAKQQRYSVGEQMRRLLKLIATKSSEEMRDQVEFLSNWR